MAHVPKQRILLVDDDADLLPLLVAHLSSAADVITVQTADAARQALTDDPFDAVVSDLQLSGKADGLWILAEAQRLQPGIRRVLMTGSALPDLPGAAVLAKPFTGEELRRILEP